MASCCTTVTSDAGVPEGRPVEWLRLGIAAAVAGQSMVLGMAVNLTPPGPQARLWIHVGLAVAALAVFMLAGLPIAAGAWRELRRGRIVVEQLFLVGIGSAFLASVQSTLTGSGSVYYEVVAVLIAIYTLGSVLGERRRGELIRAADALGSEFARCTRVTCCGNHVEMPVAGIEPGDRVLVRAGDGIPVDGRLAGGEALIREAALTGEPYPVVRRAGDPVRAGSHVLDGAVVIEATAAGTGRHLDTLLEAVRDARRHPAPIQREADRIVAWFLPTVLVIAAGTWIFWSARAGWGSGTFHALAVLLVACPCAMGLATPIGVWSALAALARRGLVCRSGAMIERLARTDFVVFDKTGTLSGEDLAVVDFVVGEDVCRERLRGIAGAVEALSKHPVARALAAWAPGDGGVRVESVRTLPGAGVEARVRIPGDGSSVEVRLGNAGILAPGVSVEGLESGLHAVARDGQRIWLTFDNRPVGLVVLRERLRDSVGEALAALKAAGVGCMVMTGDRSATALEGLEIEVVAGLAPDEKAARVKALVAAGRQVLFVGDGINDAPAMGRATAAIAMGGGADLAGETAGAVLISRDLAAVPDAILVCRSTVRAIRSNLLFAAGYNVVGIALAVLGLLHPIAAALVMFLSSGTVTWRALRHTRRLGVGEADECDAPSPGSPPDPSIPASPVATPA